MYGLNTARTCFLSCFIWLLLVTLATATTFTVQADGSGDYSTIQDAIWATSDGDVVELAPGTYTGPGNTDVNLSYRAITLRSQSGQPGLVIIDCEASSSDPRRALIINSGEGSGTVLEGLTMINGYGYQAGIVSAGALLIANASSPTVRHCVFEDNHAGMSWDHAGGAVYVDINCAPTFENCVFQGNSAYFGGAVGVNHFSTAVFVDCRFLDNVGGLGGAIFGNSTSKTRCLFARNSAEEGGAIWGNGYNDEASFNCTYSENSATLGGAICAHANYGSPVILMDTIIADSPVGEAIYAASGVVVQLSCSDLFGNAGGDWIGSFAEQVDLDGNFSANPCFCSPEDDDYSLCENSYCLPGHHPWGCDQLVGAYGNGCGECSCPGPVRVESMSWGQVKELYR